MKALVTGASGFAGAHLVHHLLESGDDVSALDRPDHPSERLASVRDRVTFFSSDICDADAVADALRAASPEAVYHLAGIAFVPTGADAPGRVMDVNLRGTVNVLEALRRHAPAARFVFASSGEVYGPLDDASLPATEVLPPRPKTIYALSKEFGERVIENYRREHGIDAVVLRLFNHIGPGQDEHFALPSFAAQIAAIEAGRAEPRLRVGNLDARRDFTDVRDVARAYRLAGTTASAPRTLNIASGRDPSIRELLESILQRAGVDAAIEVDAARLRNTDIPRIVGSPDLARTALRWTPAIPLNQTLRDILDDARARAK